MKIAWEKIIDTVSWSKYLITVPTSEIKIKLDDYLKAVSTKVHADGFRPGKAPKDVILNTIGVKKIIEDLKPRIQNEAFENLTRSTKDKPVGPPGFSESELKLDTDFSFEVEFAKEIRTINPSHESHIPIIGDLSGGPSEIYNKLHQTSSDKLTMEGNIPTDVSNSLPNRISLKHSTRIADYRNPLSSPEQIKPEPGKTNIQDETPKVVKPAELVVDMPHKKLDESLRMSGEKLEEKLPKVEIKADTSIKEPESEPIENFGDSEKNIKSPSPHSRDATETKKIESLDDLK